ncbi:hypothetical protein [Streptomyces sp. AJS327]|nr:hypothetical protein [Streptomyces sp. AJS327]
MASPPYTPQPAVPSATTDVPGLKKIPEHRHGYGAWAADGAAA